MGIKDWFSSKKEYEYEERMVSFYDEEGIEHNILLKDYVEKILNKEIDSNFNNSNALYEIILNAFDKEIYYPVERAINRLNEIEKSERSINLKAIYYLKNEKYEDVIFLYDKFFRNNGYDKISSTAYYNYARAFDLMEDKRCLEEYKKAIYKSPNTIEFINYYIDANKKYGENDELEILEEISKINNSYKPQLAYLLKLQKRIVNDSLNISDYKNIISENVKKIIVNSKGNREVLKRLANILLELNLFEEYEDEILPIYINEKDLIIYKQILFFYITKRNYEDGYNYIRKIVLNDLTLDEIKELIKYERELINRRKKEKEVSKKEFITYDKPLFFNFYPEQIKVESFQQKSNKNMYIVPISYISENVENFSEKYIESVNAINSFLLEQIYLNTNINVKSTFYVEDSKPIIFTQKYSKEYIYNIAVNSPKVDYLIFGEIKNEDTNILKIYINLYNTRTGIVKLLASSILNEDFNENFVKILLSNLEKEISEKLEGIKYDRDEEIFQKDIFKFLLNYNNNNKYSLLKEMDILENLILKYKNNANSEIKQEENFRDLLKITAMLFIIKNSDKNLSLKYIEKFKKMELHPTFMKILELVEN